jgi:hypothetical protein
MIVNNFYTLCPIIYGSEIRRGEVDCSSIETKLRGTQGRKKCGRRRVRGAGTRKSKDLAPL